MSEQRGGGRGGKGRGGGQQQRGGGSGQQQAGRGSQQQRGGGQQGDDGGGWQQQRSGGGGGQQRGGGGGEWQQQRPRGGGQQGRSGQQQSSRGGGQQQGVDGGGWQQQGGGRGEWQQQRPRGGGQQGGGGGGQQQRPRGGGQQQGGGGGDWHQQRAGGGGGRGQQGSGGGRGHRGGSGGRGGPPPTYLDPKAYPDPYSLPYTPAQQKCQVGGWKDYNFETKDDVKLQVYSGPPAKWADYKIKVSLNHFEVKSSNDPKKFAIPTLYHYDISYEIIRQKKQAETETKSQPQSVAGPSKKKGKGKGKKGSAAAFAGTEAEVVDIEQKLKDESLDDKKKKGAPPPSKKLPKYLTKAILDYLIPILRRDYRHQGLATDLSYNLYTTKLLENFIPMQHTVSFMDLHRAGLMDEEDQASVQVTFQRSLDKTGDIHTIDVSAIAEYYKENETLKGFAFSAELRQSLESACNAFVKSFPNFSYFSVGRNTIIPINTNRWPLGGGIEAWRAVSANIGMGWKPYLNVDIANCALLLGKNVVEVLGESLNTRKDPDKASKVSEWKSFDFENARSLLKSCKISYMVNGKKFGGPVRDIDKKSVSKATFKWEQKQKDVSVMNYYKENYGCQLRYPDGPVLVIRKNALVPAELCTIKEGQSYNRKLDGGQTTNMLQFAKLEADKLKKEIEKSMADMKLNQNEVLNGLEIQIPDRMLCLEDTRVLVSPALRYGKEVNGNNVAHITPNDGTWEIWSHNYAFYKPVDVKKWGVLVVGARNITEPNDSALKFFCETLQKNGKKKGVNFLTAPNPIIVENRCGYNSTVEDNARILKNVFSSQFKHCDLVVVVFPQKGDPLYGHVKHVAEIDVGILTQCVAEKNIKSFFKGQVQCSVKDATVQNILLKINSKMGGINHVTVAPLDKQKATMFSTLIMDCPILVLGADVTHAPPGSKKFVNGKEFIMPSYAAVTGSLDKTCMPYMTEVRAQRKANAGAAEVIQDLENIVVKMLRVWEKTNTLPKKIIYFRDGVGEGQFKEVLHVEMTAIRNACIRFARNYEPKITFVTVQKRHKTRIFWHSPDGKIKNAPPGTVIDTEIVHPIENDFYLCSHYGLLGTSRPSRYHILWDDSDFSKDVLQSLAYTLCYMFARCTKSVKMPAPTYYAHLAADRAKKLCEGFETKNGEPTDDNLNEMLKRNTRFCEQFPMHFV